jgi:hypothetical protein
VCAFGNRSSKAPGLAWRLASVKVLHSELPNKHRIHAALGSGLADDARTCVLILHHVRRAGPPWLPSRVHRHSDLRCLHRANGVAEIALGGAAIRSMQPLSTRHDHCMSSEHAVCPIDGGAYRRERIHVCVSVAGQLRV